MSEHQWKLGDLVHIKPGLVSDEYEGPEHEGVIVAVAGTPSPMAPGVVLSGDTIIVRRIKEVDPRHNFWVTRPKDLMDWDVVVVEYQDWVERGHLTTHKHLVEMLLRAHLELIEDGCVDSDDIDVGWMRHLCEVLGVTPPFWMTLDVDDLRNSLKELYEELSESAIQTNRVCEDILRMTDHLGNYSGVDDLDGNELHGWLNRISDILHAVSQVSMNFPIGTDVENDASTLTRILEEG